MNAEFKGIDREIDLDEVRRVEYERSRIGLTPLEGVKKVYALSITAAITVLLTVLVYALLISNVPKVAAYFANFEPITIFGMVMAGMFAIIVMNYYFFVEGDANIATLFMMSLSIGTLAGFISAIFVGVTTATITTFIEAVSLLITIFINSEKRNN